MSIKINTDELVIRPSSVDNFFQCSYQWGKVFLEGRNTIPNSRAAIGTAIHAGVEAMWQEGIADKAKDNSLTLMKNPNLGMMTDAAVEAWSEETKDGIKFDMGEDAGSCISEIVNGTEAFMEDIVPFTAIPMAVEQRYTVPIEHRIVKAISGTVDYITSDTIADVKTSKRKPTVANYSTQQGIYKFLANAPHNLNGAIKHNLIQGVILKKKPEGLVLDMEPDVEQARALTNILLDTLDLVLDDVAPIETILRPNPKYYLCSQKYCSLYGECPATKSKARDL